MDETSQSDSELQSLSPRCEPQSSSTSDTSSTAATDHKRKDLESLLLKKFTPSSAVSSGAEHAADSEDGTPTDDYEDELEACEPLDKSAESADESSDLKALNVRAWPALTEPQLFL
jgi:hypothetical protein